MRHSTWSFAIILSICIVMLANTSSPMTRTQKILTACGITSWVGKSPWDASGHFILDTPCLSKALNRSLPQQVLEKIKQWTTSNQKWGAVTSDSNLVGVSICPTKKCETDSIQLFYDGNNDMLQALMVENGKPMWYSQSSGPRPVRLIKASLCKSWKCWNKLFEDNKVGWISHMFGPNDDPGNSSEEYIPILNSTTSSFPPPEDTSVLVGDTSFQQLRKYAVMKPGVGYKDMLEDPFIVKSLGILIGKERTPMISNIFAGPSSGSILDGNIIYYSSCRQHNCIGAFIIVYVNLKENSLDVCWAEDNSSMAGKPKNFWLSSGKHPKQIGDIDRVDAMPLYRLYHK